jgi:hypothetical protein
MDAMAPARARRCRAVSGFVLETVSNRSAQDERRCCVRQKRVVLAPVAGVKSAEVFAKPNRVRKTVNSPMTEATGIRLRGERAISRQTIAQGRPDALRWTCMLVCALLCAIAHETAGAARTRSSLRPPLGESFGQASGELRREIANAYSVVIGRLDRAIQYSRGGSD